MEAVEWIRGIKWGVGQRKQSLWGKHGAGGIHRRDHRDQGGKQSLQERLGIGGICRESGEIGGKVGSVRGIRGDREDLGGRWGPWGRVATGKFCRNQDDLQV